MSASVAARFAGKTLGDFLGVVTKGVSKAAESGTLKAITSMQDFADAPGLLGLVARNPEAISKAAGVAAPAVLGGTILAGQRLLVGDQSGQRQPAASVREYRPPAYASSAYVPGRLPLTNEQAGEMLLDQQRFQHQMQLIQARQNASSGVGTLRDTSGIDSIMNLANRIYG
jgi:hypothetical protein